MKQIRIKNTGMIALITLALGMHYDYVYTAAKAQMPLSIKLINLVEAGVNQAANLARQAGAAARPTTTAARRVASQTVNVLQQGVQNTLTFWNSKFYKDFVEPIYVGNELSRNYLHHKKKQLDKAIDAFKSFKAQIQDYLNKHKGAQEAMDNYEEMINLFAEMHDNLALNQNSPEYQKFMQLFTQKMDQTLQSIDTMLSSPDFQVFAATRPQVQAMLTETRPADDAMLRSGAQDVRPAATKPLTENDIEKIMQQTTQRREALAFEDQAHEMLPGKPLVIER